MSCPVTGEPRCKCIHADNNVYCPPDARSTARKLWTDHAVFTSKFIVAFLDDRPEAEAIQPRLLANQPELGTFYGQYVGGTNGEAISKLLTDHILGAVGVLKAVKTGVGLDAALQVVYSNIDQFSEAVDIMTSGVLTKTLVYAEFLKHNQYVVELAKLHHQRQYAEAIRVYDAYYTHMLSFSDMLTEGLVYR